MVTGWTDVAGAAAVKQVNAKKKLISIALGEDETMEKDALVCVFTESGKKVDCGTVKSVKGTVAIVVFKSTKKFKRLKVGMQAKVGAEPPGTEDDTEASANTAKKPKNAVKEGKTTKSPLRIWALYSAALSTPAVYNKLGYAAPSSETPETLWSDDKTTKSSLFGFNFQVGIPLGAFSVNPGFRYRKFTPSVVDSDYVSQRADPYTSTDETASALGIWTDFQFYRMAFSGASSFWLSSGIDMDMSTVTLKTTKKDDSGATAETEIAKAESKLSVLSLRLGAATDLVFTKVFGVSVGTTIMIPLSASGKFSGDLADGEGQGQADPGEDLKKALGHKKNTVAYELSLGAVLAF